MLPEPIGIDDVARLLGRSPDWLRRHLGELTRRHGFPRPLLPTGRMVWHPMAVEAWRLRHAPAELLRELADELRMTMPAVEHSRDELLARLDDMP